MGRCGWVMGITVGVAGGKISLVAFIIGAHPADGTQQCQNHAEKVSDRDQKGGQVNDERRHKNHDQKGCPECPDDSPVGVVQVKGRIAAVVCPCQRQGREQRDQGAEPDGGHQRIMTAAAIENQTSIEVLLCGESRTTSIHDATCFDKNRSGERTFAKRTGWQWDVSAIGRPYMRDLAFERTYTRGSSTVRPSRCPGSSRTSP